MKKICVIVGAGDFDGFYQKYNTDETLFIAADGGCIYYEQNNIIPEIWIGDSDSLEGELELAEECVQIHLPVEKDDTDILAAVKYGLERGCDVFHIYGGLGGKRLDHTIANIKILSFLSSKGMEAYLFGPNRLITVAENGTLYFSEKEEGTISVFSLKDQSAGVTIQGLKYEIENASLTETDSIGVSNAFINQKSFISVKCGRLLIVLEKLPHELPVRA